MEFYYLNLKTEGKYFILYSKIQKKNNKIHLELLTLT